MQMNNFVEVLSPTPQNIDRNNCWFAFLVAGGLGVFGSVLTAMIGSAFVIVLLLQLLGKMEFAVRGDIWKVAAFFLCFFLISSLLAIVHFDNGKNLHVIINRLPFLTFLPLVVALSYSRPNGIQNFLESGAVLGSVLAMVFAIFEITNGQGRAEGADGNAGPFAVSLCLAYAICLLGMVRSKNTRRSVIMLVGAISAIVCVLASGMRVTWPLLLILPLIAVGSRGGIRLENRWPYFVGSVVVVATLAFVFLGDTIISRLWQFEQNVEQIINLGQYDNSLGERIIMWDFAWRNLADIVLIGMGKTQALAGLAEFSQNEYGFRISRTHFHNFLINAIMRGGILELIATIALLVGPLIVAWKYRYNPASRYGFVFMFAIVTIYFVSGTLNIAFGHDIQDSLYTYMMAVASFLVFGNVREGGKTSRARVIKRPNRDERQ